MSTTTNVYFCEECGPVSQSPCRCGRDVTLQSTAEALPAAKPPARKIREPRDPRYGPGKPLSFEAARQLWSSLHAILDEAIGDTSKDLLPAGETTSVSHATPSLNLGNSKRLETSCDAPAGNSFNHPETQ